MAKKNNQSSLGMNAVYKMILNVFNLLVPLFVGPYIAGLLDKDLYGIYNRVYAEFQIFFTLGAFGIYNYGVREISRVRSDEKKTREVFTSLFTIGVISNIVVTVFYAMYFNVRGNGIDKYVYLVMIIQMISNIFYIEFVNEAVENYAFITKKTIIVRLIYLIAIFGFVRKPTDVVIYSVVVSMTVFLNNFISYCYLKRQYKFSLDDIRLKKHIIPLIISLLLVNVELLYAQLDKIMLSPFVNDIAVTEYTIPTTLVGMVATIPLSLISVSIPRLSSYVGTKDVNSYKNTLENSIRVYMSILIPMALGMLVLSEEIMWLYTKDVYTYAYPVLALSAIARIVYGYESIVMNLMMYVWGFEKKLTIYLLCGGIFNLVSNLLLALTGKFSAFSSLFTTVIACALVTIFSKKYFEKQVNMKVRFFCKPIIRYFVVAATFIPIALIVKSIGMGYWFNIIVIVAICVGVYGILLLVTKDPLLDIILGVLKRKTNHE
ncbi:MAG: oligosaccharide flippase family protein [Bacillales bacterium]|nr:oligosaccharide flippase family protein [Bacillales bacterium]